METIVKRIGIGKKLDIDYFYDEVLNMLELLELDIELRREIVTKDKNGNAEYVALYIKGLSKEVEKLMANC